MTARVARRASRVRALHATLRLAFAGVLGATLCVSSARAQATLPDRYADSTFWRLINDLSEPGGTFRSDNLLSNETSYQWVVPALQLLHRPDAVYLGVAPEQNFTFIAGLRPKVAFIIDIRRGNLLAHLMYKALFEMSDNRVDFAFRLFGRARPSTLPGSASVEELFTVIGTAPRDSGITRRTLSAIHDRLIKTHGFPLSTEDTSYIGYVYESFTMAGPGIRYNMGGGFGGGFSGGGRRGFGGMPNYADLMLETDSLGAKRSYLATDENYRIIKDMQDRNVIIPFTGDFAGPKALRAFGQYVKDHKATVAAIYVSNVEQYLFQDPSNWKRYYENVRALPTDSTTVFIRSASQGYGVRMQSVNSRQNELLCPVSAHMKGFDEGRILSYYDVFQFCR
ncbi:MAG: hypothetical protein FJ202_06215 [Gemmatimonadetes bacterium]|nr:hypothetical protein [Gemmatimonadota bacterium]